MRKEKLQNKQLKLHTDLASHKAGEVISIECTDGVPMDRYWRDRVKDSEIDGCVSFVEPEPTSRKSEPKPEVELGNEKKSPSKIKSRSKE
ncbi:MAG: hypothetical protein QQN63_04495 [Nitrosopumilus sp.]